MSKFKDLTGLKFGRLTAVKRAADCGHHTRWECECECGNKTISHTTSLTSGRSKSCGCLNHETIINKITKHGGRHDKLYGHWCGMKKRCYNPKYEHYDRYGGRGITICDEWLNNYGSFKEWAECTGHKEGLTIDRIDNNGNYEPQNCRWVNQKEQVRNRSTTIYIEYDGKKKPLKEWCELLKINYKLAHARYKRGLNPEQIFK
jgi:hypothetical protein